MYKIAGGAYVVHLKLLLIGWFKAAYLYTVYLFKMRKTLSSDLAWLTQLWEIDPLDSSGSVDGI